MNVFPLLIKISLTEDQFVIYIEQEIPVGIEFVVIETNTKSVNKHDHEIEDFEFYYTRDNILHVRQI